MKYPKTDLGTIEAVWNKLGGEEGVKLFLSGRRQIVWLIWKTFSLHLGSQAAKAICEDLEAIGCLTDAGVKDLNYGDAYGPVDVELVVASVADLGFKEGETCRKIFDRASELGLDLCPAEVGPALRRLYTDQPNGEWLLIAMHSVIISRGDLQVLCVGRHNDGKRCLHGREGHPDNWWPAKTRWVFTRRKIERSGIVM